MNQEKHILKIIESTKEMLLKKVRRKMVEGYDDFYNYYCIKKEDWEKIKEDSHKNKNE